MLLDMRLKLPHQIRHHGCMTKHDVPYKESAKYPCKKTLSLSAEIDDMWNKLSQIHKVKVVEALRPLVEDRIRDLFILHTK